MRLILRVVGTWLLGLALILLIIDGTSRWAPTRFVWTALGDTWTGLSADSLLRCAHSSPAGSSGRCWILTFEALLRLPGWVVLAVPG